MSVSTHCLKSGASQSSKGWTFLIHCFVSAAGVRPRPLRRVGLFLLRAGSGRGGDQDGLPVGGEVCDQTRVPVGPVERDGPGATAVRGRGRRRQSELETLEHDGRSGHRRAVWTHVSPGQRMKKSKGVKVSDANKKKIIIICAHL